MSILIRRQNRRLVYIYFLGISNSRKALLRLVGLSTSTDMQRPEWPLSSNSPRVLLPLVGLVASTDIQRLIAAITRP